MNPALGGTNYKIWSPKRSIATANFNYTANDLERGATSRLCFHRKWTWCLPTVGHSYEVFCAGGVKHKNIWISTSRAVLCHLHWREANHNTCEWMQSWALLLCTINVLSLQHMQIIVNKLWGKRKILSFIHKEWYCQRHHRDGSSPLEMQILPLLSPFAQ